MYHKEVRVVKLFKRAMPILLSAAMAASMLLPAAAANQGSGETTTTATEGSYDKSIVMVDAGRKYFSVDSLKSIIDSASSAGMHYVMLGLGNDGMRFLLDDMSLTVGDTTYTSEEVSTAIHAGNEAYSDFEVDELTEDDMDAIMSHADSKGVEIIPLINTPGHMDAILDTADVRMEGFEKLTFEQQLEVLNNPENFAGLSRAANGSRQHKSYSEWTHYKKGTSEEIKVDEAFRQEMIEKEKEYLM